MIERIYQRKSRIAIFCGGHAVYWEQFEGLLDSPRWGTTDSVDIVEHLMPFWCENYFSRENYLVIDNNPVLFLFGAGRLEEVWPDSKEQAAAFDACREYAKGQGFDGMIFAVCNTAIGPEKFLGCVAAPYQALDRSGVYLPSDKNMVSHAGRIPDGYPTHERGDRCASGWCVGKTDLYDR